MSKRYLVEVIEETPSTPASPEMTKGTDDWRLQTKLSPDLRTALWFGTIHHFTRQQGLAIQRLWQAWESGLPDLHQATVLEAADSSAGKLPKLFAGHSAWGAMIHPSTSFGGRVGCYRLNKPV
jgi:hypothetical protein